MDVAIFSSTVSISPWEIVGLTGAGLYTLSYLLAAFDRLPSQSPLYYAANMLAAGLVMVSLNHSFNLASAVIQTFFISVSIIGIARHYSARRRARAYSISQNALGARTDRSGQVFSSIRNG